MLRLVRFLILGRQRVAAHDAGSTGRNQIFTSPAKAVREAGRGLGILKGQAHD